MTNVGYRRVSTADQSTERQLDGLTLDKVFEDKASGGTTNRPALEALQDYVRDGDTVHVHSIDRLARDMEDLQRLVREFRERGVTLKFHKENMTFDANEQNPMNQLMFDMLASFARFERSMIRERQREGIKKAKQRGVYRGGKKTVDRTRFTELLAQGMKPAHIAKEMGVSRQTIYRLKAETG